ncbi:hypothetical protein F2Q70_00012950 [Brassica cretica]|uniref:phosphoethanolamine N-methyltransferase n=1 Tax=Brassica cretica TaxID=69181 RepID=A0A8S9LUI1_BRACR|nr:hypothetical protein F2Q70_00012950 [Brassica cretica]
MILFALERAIGFNCLVEFKVADCTTKHYPENSFDVIYSRDTSLHIQHCSRLSSSGLNQEAKCSSATTVRAPKLHLPSFQSTSSREDMISLMFKLMGRCEAVKTMMNYLERALNQESLDTLQIS